jgi:hypothetical protein
MKIITKKIGSGRYAYLAAREGGRVVHKYLGRTDDPRVISIASYKNKTAKVPESLRVLFWDTSLNNLNIKGNARYIIERVLEFGDMEALWWLQMVYPARDIVDVLNLSRTLDDKSRNFWLIWFGAPDA